MTEKDRYEVMGITVHDLAVMDESEWNFRHALPKWHWRQYRDLATFDPFPAYPHVRADALAAVELVTAHWPPSYGIEVYLADREEISRSNGFSQVNEGGHYEDGEWVKDTPNGVIVLSGKRIPPHPAVTRYLVAHEYGHHVEWMLSFAAGAQHAHDDGLLDEYADLRGLPRSSRHHGSGGVWHKASAEVFACDFRIIVCGVEPDYWPHPGVMHPRLLPPPVLDWWEQRIPSPAAEAVA